MSKTLIILNPNAASGQAGVLWKKIEPILWEKLGNLVVAVTQRPEDVAAHLGNAYASGLTRVISIGGDGTNHAMVNAIADLKDQHPNGEPIIYGTLPVGTGRDWARGMGMPIQDVEQAAAWIAEAKPKPVDVGLVKFDDQKEHFLNITSAGLGGEVARRVNSVAKRRPWTFLKSTIETILSYKVAPTRVEVDGELWYEGKMYVLAVANGTTFGHGMKVAPEAKNNDGLFDVVLVKDVSRLDLLMAFSQVYKGTHLTHPSVKFGRGKTVRVTTSGSALDMELDGEVASAREMTFEIRPGLLNLLS